MDRYVSPLDDAARPPVAWAPRPATLEGASVGLLDIAKTRSDEFLDRVEELLRGRGVAQVVRLRKPTFARPAPDEVLAEADRCGAVIEALAD
jgi:hypothetical protein